jgi:transcriptional regulator with XRE-family HTH domain
MKLNEKIKRLRKENGLSQVKLSELAGIHKTHFSRLERGLYKPSVEVLKKIAEILNVSTDYLIKDDVNEFEPVKIENKNLIEKVRLIETLEPKEQDAIMSIIDSLLTKKKFVDLVMKETGLANRIPKTT